MRQEESTDKRKDFRKIMWSIREIPRMILHLISGAQKYDQGWVQLIVINVELELRSGTVWNSSLRMIRRYAITILIRHGGGDSPALVFVEV